MKEFKSNEVKFLKIGKIAKHSTKSNGKDYLRAKLYLKDSSLIGKGCELYDLGDIGIEETFGIVKGKGLLIFFPYSERTKDKIGMFGEHRAFNRYLGKIKKF